MNIAAETSVTPAHKGIKEIPSQAYLRECFDYRDGWLYWKRRPVEHFSEERHCTAWCGRMVGKRSGLMYKRPNGKDGYVKTTINDKAHSAHRIIWVWHHGDIPAGMQIDHIDGDGWNNKIENLRLATITQNAQNQWTPGNKSSALPKGVVKNRTRFMTKIRINGVRHYLGTFKNVEDAAKAYQDAAKKFHGEFAKF